MNGRTRQKLYCILVSRSGDQCGFCKIPGSEKQLVIDHIDNDNSHNNLDNLQLLCRRCNYIKNSRRPVDSCVSDTDDAIQINKTKEQRFRNYVYDTLNKLQQINPKKLIDSGAEYCGISPVTAKRYLDKMCSKEGLCSCKYGLIFYDQEHPLFKGEIDSYDGMFRNK